ncbi:MAG: ABC transporter permease [SAR202 cluster bacterium]|jgi:peptide/nickel transport system permease protein|nr:ABC transporter permease [SAR202 cluster bacterium]
MASPSLIIEELQKQPNWFARKMRDLPVVPIAILSTILFAAIFAPLISPHDPEFMTLADRNAKPFWYDNSTGKFPLGADALGRDILSRIIYGTRISLLVSFVAIVTGVVIGGTLGMIAGYLGSHIDEFIMRLCDISLAIPYILIALVAVIIFGQSIPVLLAILAFSTWSAFARQIRGETLVLKELDYVALAKVAGASQFRILVRHIFPGVVNTIIVIATLRVGAVIMFEAILSYLGAGIPPPTPSWGSMVSDGRDYLPTAWWIAFFPGLAIFLTVTALNFLGDWLRDKLDPRLRQSV